MEIKKYPDGASYVNIASSIDTPFHVFKVNNYEDLWHLNQLVDVYNHQGKKPTILIPNLIDAQADRRFETNQSSGLKLVCKFLNGMDANFKIFHPHNAEVVEAMMDNVEIIDNSEFIIKVLYSHMGLDLDDSDKDNLILMSSDAGGFKSLMKLCDQLDWKGQTYSASKARTKDGMKQLVDCPNFGGKDIVIIDDISVYGGTFKGLAKLLKERNCGKLYLAVSHMTMQNLGYDDPVTNYFDKVFTTNSKFETYTRYDNTTDLSDGRPENLEIIKLF
jgi:ribose-phosphate pyrophosphokinase